MPDIFSMWLGNISFYFFLSFVLGAFVWLQKDVLQTEKKWLLSKKNDVFDGFGSVRSYGLIAIFGALMQFLDRGFGSVLAMTILWFVLVSIMVNIDYIYHVFKKQQHSPASEISAILVYLLWVLVLLGQIKLAIIVAIALSVVVGSKNTLRQYLTKISPLEIRNTLKFAAIAFVVLPLLPDVKYSFASLFSALGMNMAEWISHPLWTMQFFNPYSLWLFVVVMSGISYLGYILTRIFWSTSGILLSSFMGWLVSSTAVTASMSDQSLKHKAKSDIYAVWALIASWVMFVRVIAVVAVLYFALLADIFVPALVMLVVFLAITGYYMYHAKDEVEDVHLEKRVQSPFKILPAIKFAGLILIIKFLAGLGIIYKDIFPEGIFYYTLGLVSGLADVDAITMTMSSDAKTGGIAGAVAATTILIAVMSNNLVKGSIAWRFGEKKFWKKVMFAFVASTIAGIVTITIQNFS